MSSAKTQGAAGAAGKTGRATQEPPREWVESEPGASQKALVGGGVPQELAGLLSRRGIETPEQARAFLEPRAADLHDPFLLAGMPEAVDRLLQARDNQEKVAIVGDYDVDGVTATALLSAVLAAHRIDAMAIIPHRIKEGYGLQPVHVERSAQARAGLIVTVDCGTTATRTVELALERGLDVIVTDHHIPGPEFPDRAILINPLRPDCCYPFKVLAGVGLALKLSQALCAKSGREIPLAPLLRMACLGTIADVVPLYGENRIIATLGLRALDELLRSALRDLEPKKAAGIKALLRCSGVKPPLSSEDVGYRIGPRINAAGRLASADEALGLLLSREPQRAQQLAEELDQFNRDRQKEERLVVEQARAVFEERLENEALPDLLIAWSEEWHRGVVGIAAGRLARRFHRPTVLLAVDGDSATGSGRSIPGVNLHGFLKGFKDRYERFGGHEFAVGMTVRTDQLEGLRREIEQQAKWPEDVLIRRYEYELTLTPEEVNVDLFKRLQQLEPHGPTNLRPLIRVGPLELKQRAAQFGKGHLKARANGLDGGALWLLGWGFAERAAELEAGPFEALGRLGWDDYLGVPVLDLADIRAL